MTRNQVATVWMAGALGVASVLAALTLLGRGADPDGIVTALQITARWSFLLFWAAYAGSALASLCGPALQPLARRGREFGLAYAAAHLVHLALVIWLYQIVTRPPLPPRMFVFFSVGMIWTYLLAALSFQVVARYFSPRQLHLLRVVGMNYILLAFAYDFVLTTIRFGTAHLDLRRAVVYLPFAVLSLAAPLLRLAAAARRRRQLVGQLPA